ncbi:transposase, IS605 OrfB family protein [Microseira wollei NIES-4236]|uniref:Transposase, IS605 OrfB family protein n=2 Tax=Microseira wollei TaxID=467598 RepID=A0AAV3XBM0_9CYAN|nr:transposase, IS605 OrfB family protein [Microseira wollei NIES-4236]
MNKPNPFSQIPKSPSREAILSRLRLVARRWMEAVNHTISRRIVRFAEYHNADVVIEDLEGCRNTMKQSQKNRFDHGESRHAWAYYSLEQKLDYKLALKGLKLIKRPDRYTSKSCSTCGTIGNRKKHDFNCPLGHHHNADLNAALNLALRGWFLMFFRPTERCCCNGFIW